MTVSASTVITRGSVSVDQVARLSLIEPRLLERLSHEALTVPTEWVREYGPYQSGGWGTLSLLNASGKSKDVVLEDSDPVETDLLQKMPATQEFLSTLGLSYMWVRLARLERNSFLWEHRDYHELDSSERHRVHVPLVTNSSAALVVGGVKVHLRAGHLWRLTPTHAHGACNLLGPDRLHLILDCYADEALVQLSAGQRLEDGDVQRLPTVTAGQLDEHVATARDLAQLGYERTAEKYLLRLFFEYNLPPGRVYELITALYESLGRAADAEEWRANRTQMLGLS